MRLNHAQTVWIWLKTLADAPPRSAWRIDLPNDERSGYLRSHGQTRGQGSARHRCGVSSTTLYPDGGITSGVYGAMIARMLESMVKKP